MFKIVSSSAGSGKTYTLTKEYLKLAIKAEGDQAHLYFKRILAITFTKAATREMKDRIVSKLQAFAGGQDDFMLDDIVRELYPNASPAETTQHKAQLRQRAERIFTQILHDYSDFAVMTIDSFTQRLVSAFTEELRMPFAFEVEMESGELLETSVERMLEKAGGEAAQDLTEILEEFYLETSEEGQSWHNLPDSLAQFAKALLSEKSYAFIEKNVDLQALDFKSIRLQLKTFQKQFEQNLETWATAALQIIKEAQLAENEFSSSTVPNYFNKKIDFKTKKDWQKGISENPGSNELKAFEEDKGWSSQKAKPHVVSAIEGIKLRLVELYEQTEVYRKQHVSTYLLYEQLTPYLYHLSLLNEIKIEFDRQLSEGNRVHISEFNQKILKIVSEEPVPFIYERLGEKFNHILIDEFQDTSKLQFANLLPLIDNSLGYDHFNLIVGDSKQAIYRFRGGDMDQIVGLHSKKLDKIRLSLAQNELTLERLESVKYHLKPDSLQTNYRSTAEVIEFNNVFFGFVAEQYEADFGMVKAVFNEDFKQQVPPKALRGGHVQFEFIERKKKSGDDDESDTPLMLERVLALVEQALANGYQLGDVSVLCRSKKHAKLIASLLKDHGHGVISEDSLSLQFSGAVNLLTAFMRVLIKPDSGLDKYEALYLFFRVIMNKTPDNEDNTKLKIAVDAPDVRTFYEYVNSLLRQNQAATTPQQSAPSNGQLSLFGLPSVAQKSPPILEEKTIASVNPYQLLQLNVYELAEKLITTFGLFGVVSERDYLFRFLDVVLEFSTRQGSHLGDFLEHWKVQKEKVSISAPSDPRAVTVQTIHKSKGMEYPIVIIPYAEWTFVPDGKRDEMWVDLDETAELLLPPTAKNLRPVLKSGSVKLKSILGQTTANVAQQYQDEKERFFIENMNLLYVAFTRPTQQLYVLSSQKNFSNNTGGTQNRVNYWFHQFLTKENKWKPDEHIYVISEGKNIAAAVHHSATEAQQTYIPNVISNDRSRTMRLRRQAERLFDVETFELKKDQGRKLKYALSLLKSSRDLEKVLQQLLVEGIAEANELRLIKKGLENVIQHPDLRAFFEAETDSLNEREILTPDGTLYRPDRVLRLADRVVILSYQTAAPNEQHAKDLQRYAQLYRQMGYADFALVLVYLDEKNVSVRILE